MRNVFRATPSISLQVLLPTDDDADYHPHSDLQCTPIALISTFAGSDTGVKGNRAFYDRKIGLQGSAEKMRGKLLINIGIWQRQETLQSGVPTEFISVADIRAGSPTEVFHLQMFPRKEISLVSI